MSRLQQEYCNICGGKLGYKKNDTGRCAYCSNDYARLRATKCYQFLTNEEILKLVKNNAVERKKKFLDREFTGNWRKSTKLPIAFRRAIKRRNGDDVKQDV